MTLPTWSDTSINSIPILYRTSQQIDIFVEDKDSEVFYSKLLNRLVNTVKIKKIFPLNSRIKVVERCKEYNETFPALFIIDGDIDLLCDDREAPHARLFQHRMYCIENYLFCKTAAIEVIENISGQLTVEEIETLLDWENFSTKLVNDLIELFKIYAVTHILLPTEKTISLGYYSLCTESNYTTKQGKKKKKSILCPNKINATQAHLKQTILNSGVSIEKYEQTCEEISKNLEKYEHYHVISGKDYLLKALWDHLTSNEIRPPTEESFKFMLGKYCDIAPFQELANAIRDVANNKIFIQT